MNAPIAEALPARQSRFNRFMTRWLASPLGFLSGRVVLVRYTGRLSGLQRQLPVNAARYDDGYLIRVGYPERKRSWRNFIEPRPIELVRAGRVVTGIAVAVAGTTGLGQRIAADYFTVHHGQAKRAGLPRMHKSELPSPEALQAAASPLVFVVVTPRASS
jgi:hypothetical protein